MCHFKQKCHSITHKWEKQKQTWVCCCFYSRTKNLPLVNKSLAAIPVLLNHWQQTALPGECLQHEQFVEMSQASVQNKKKNSSINTGNERIHSNHHINSGYVNKVVWTWKTLIVDMTLNLDQTWNFEAFSHPLTI